VKWHGGTLGTREIDSHPRSPPGDEPSRCSRVVGTTLPETMIPIVAVLAAVFAVA
jgi:hypothetical protein